MEAVFDREYGDISIITVFEMIHCLLATSTAIFKGALTGKKLLQLLCFIGTLWVSR